MWNLMVFWIKKYVKPMENRVLRIEKESVQVKSWKVKQQT